MNQILTLQQISDIDTFTLQQKIQQMEQHPLSVMYEQIIAIAKLQLNQRYKVQQFGRMLINDQIPLFGHFNPSGNCLFPEIHTPPSSHLPQISPVNFIAQNNGFNPSANRKQNSRDLQIGQIKRQKQTQSQYNMKTISNSSTQRKVEYVQFLKKSLITDSDAMIGKPTLGNDRYVSKQGPNNYKQKKPSLTEEKQKQKKSTSNSNLFTKRQQQEGIKKNKLKPIIPLPNLKSTKINTEQTDRNRRASIINKQKQKTKQTVQQKTKQENQTKQTLSVSASNSAKKQQIKEESKKVYKNQVSIRKLYKEQSRQKQGITKTNTKEKKDKIRYIQNDVYDGQKLVLDRPQKLADIRIDTQNQPSQGDGHEILSKDQQTSSGIVKQKIKQRSQEQIEQEIQKSMQFVDASQKYLISSKQNPKQNINDQQQIRSNVQQKQDHRQQHNDSIVQQIKILQESKYRESKQPKFVIHQHKHRQALIQDQYIRQLPSITMPYSTNSTNQPMKMRTTNNSPRKQVEAQIVRQQVKIEQKQRDTPLDLKLSIQTKNKNKTNAQPSKSSRTVSLYSQFNQGSKNQHQQQQLHKQQFISVNPQFGHKQTKQVPNNQTTQSETTNIKHHSKTVTSLTRAKKILSIPGTSIGQQQQNYSNQHIPRQIPNMFCYHEVVPTFNKLFPHCTSLINDLRSIQKQLLDHLNKKINRLSLNDQYLVIRQNQLLFKVVSQCEKASKYRHVFDIDLDSYMKRSKVMIQRIKKNSSNPAEQTILLYRVVRQKQDVYDIINNAFHRTQQWFQLPHGMDLKMSWNLLWTWSKPQIDIKQLFYFQKVNHFFGNKQIARKDLLKKNIQRIKKLGPKAKAAFDIIPQTYFLPGENMQFVRKFRQYSMKAGLNYWIMKPVGLSRGRGIQLVTKIQQIVFSQPVVVQKYLQNPLLLDQYKFDMRIYVLVTSMNPLQAYVYKEGFARISTQKYTLQDENIHNKFVHLTNFSVQKENTQQQNKIKQIQALSAFEKQIGGCKITLKTLKQKLAKQGISWQSIQSQIDSIVLKSLVSTMNVIQQNPNCFQLFGYDIIIDENLKCWLIQVNSSPSLQKDFTIDQIVKQQLVDDIIQIVDPIPYDRARLLDVVTRRRKQLQGLKSHINTQNNSTSQLNTDLHYILHGRPLRKYGQPISNQNFRRIAPGDMYQSIIRTVQQYKLSSITKEQT